VIFDGGEYPEPLSPNSVPPVDAVYQPENVYPARTGSGNVTGDPISKFADGGETLPPLTTLYVTTNGCGVTAVIVAVAALLPVALFATTENLYPTVFVSPSKTQLVAAGVIVQVTGPGSGFPDESSTVTV
jgi:hypothetical protein